MKHSPSSCWSATAGQSQDATCHICFVFIFVLLSKIKITHVRNETVTRVSNAPSPPMHQVQTRYEQVRQLYRSLLGHVTFFIWGHGCLCGGKVASLLLASTCVARTAGLCQQAPVGGSAVVKSASVGYQHPKLLFHLL
jgi:hypothetical protein